MCVPVCVSPPEPGLKLLAFSLDSSSWHLPYHFRMHFSPPFYLLCFVIDFRHLTPKYTHRGTHTHTVVRRAFYAVFNRCTHCPSKSGFLFSLIPVTTHDYIWLTLLLTHSLSARRDTQKRRADGPQKDCRRPS